MRKGTSHPRGGAAPGTPVTAPLLHDPGGLVVTAAPHSDLHTVTTLLDPTAAMVVEGRHRLQRTPCDGG